MYRDNRYEYDDRVYRSRSPPPRRYSRRNRYDEEFQHNGSRAASTLGGAAIGGLAGGLLLGPVGFALGGLTGAAIGASANGHSDYKSVGYVQMFVPDENGANDNQPRYKTYWVPVYSQNHNNA